MSRKHLKNLELRAYAKEKNVFIYELAERLNVPDSTFTRVLRKELTPETENEYRAIIDEIAKENETA